MKETRHAMPPDFAPPPQIAADLLPLQAGILEAIAMAEPLERVLDELCRRSEEIVGECVASIMMYDEPRERLNVISAPNLPQAAVEMVNGTVPGEGAGSCANAVFHSAPTYVEDVQVDNVWCHVRDIASKLNIGACWSFPVFLDGRVCGSFAITSFSKRKPDALCEQLLRTSAHLAGVAIERARKDEELLQFGIAFRNTSEGMLVADASRRVFRSNPAWQRMSGFAEADTIGRCLLDLLIEDPVLCDTIRSTILCGEPWRGEINCRRSDRQVFPALLNISTVPRDGGIGRYVAVVSDISMLKASEKRLSYLAHHDVLTDLPNRFAFEKLLEGALGEDVREEAPLALLFIDLDDFKKINDARGHAAGDKVLKLAGARLRDCVRDCDVVARLGGDEFTIMLNYRDLKVVEQLAGRVIRNLSEPFHVDDRDYFISASVGIALAPADGDRYSTLIKHADAAMYQAKKLGKHRYSFYTSELTHTLQARLKLEEVMRHACENREYVLCYQPQFDASGNVEAVEALLQWTHPAFSAISSEEIDKVAEQAGVLHDIGERALREGCRQLRQWCSSGHSLRLAINVSRRQIRNGFEQMMKTVLTETGVDPAFVELEITESILLEEQERCRRALRAVADMGVRLSIDDFGSGRSSLGDLKNLPVHALKIDGALIGTIADCDENRAITRAIVAMGHAMDLSVIAAGIATQDQHLLMSESGCDRFQGCWLAEPVSADELGRMLES